MMKRVLKFLTGRLFLFGLMILLQIAWIILLVFDVSVRYQYFMLGIRVLAILISFYVVTRWSNPSVKLSWIFFITAVPIIGVPLYLIFGRPGLTRATRRRMDAVNAGIEGYLTVDESLRQTFQSKHPQASLQSDYILHASHYPLYTHTDSQYFPCGEDFFEALLSDISQAEHFIFLEYFIFDQGSMYDRLMDALVQKVKEGVEVRLIYDDVGCIQNMPPHFYRQLQAQGIKCAAFNPARPILSIIMNHRDHRKITVIDGKIAYTGGINIADEYINEMDRFGYWKDAGIRLQGVAARSFLVMFLEMWDYIVGGASNYEKLFALTEQASSDSCDGYVQPYGDTPLDHENVSENTYLNMINRATKYVYIYTPYLILDQEMIVALSNAAKSGVDVRIITPGIPDKKMIYLLTRSHYEPLLKKGVRIFEYSPGFLHAKCFACDDSYATVGSINLDYRSLYLHFECGVFLYHTTSVMQVADDMRQTIDVSREITLEDCQHRHPLGMRMLHALLRLLAPLL